MPIVFDVSAVFRAGQISAVIGPNGAGKSTLIKAIFGQCHIFGGTVLLDGRPVQPVTPQLLVREGVAYVPQLANVFPSLTVRDNLEIGGYIRGGTDFKRVFDLFPALREFMDKRAGKLSGGQRNMVAVARALMSDPRVLLLDEATSGLSPLLSGALWERLITLAHSGIAVGIVEQNVATALEHSDYVYLMSSGRLKVHGPSNDLAVRSDLDALFLDVAPSER